MLKRCPVIALLLVLAACSADPNGQTRQKLYVLSSNSNDVTVIDVATNEILTSVEVGELPHGIATPKSQFPLYVATEGDDGLAVVDPVNDALIKIRLLRQAAQRNRMHLRRPLCLRAGDG